MEVVFTPTVTSTSWPFSTKSFPHFLKTLNRQISGRSVLVMEDYSRGIRQRRFFTFGELFHLSTTVMTALMGNGLEPGDVCCVYLENIPEYLPILWGIIRSGLVPLLIPPTTRPDNIVFFCDFTGASALFIMDSLLPSIRENVTNCQTLKFTIILTEGLSHSQSMSRPTRHFTGITPGMDTIPEDEYDTHTQSETETFHSLFFQPVCQFLEWTNFIEHGKRTYRSKKLSGRRIGLSLDNPCVMLLTSGTTGFSRIVVGTHANIMAGIASVRHILPSLATSTTVLVDDAACTPPTPFPGLSFIPPQIAVTTISETFLLVHSFALPIAFSLTHAVFSVPGTVAISKEKNCPSFETLQLFRPTMTFLFRDDLRTLTRRTIDTLLSKSKPPPTKHSHHFSVMSLLSVNAEMPFIKQENTFLLDMVRRITEDGVNQPPTTPANLKAISSSKSEPKQLPTSSHCISHYSRFWDSVCGTDFRYLLGGSLRTVFSSQANIDSVSIETLSGVLEGGYLRLSSCLRKPPKRDNKSEKSSTQTNSGEDEEPHSLNLFRVVQIWWMTEVFGIIAANSLPGSLNVTITEREVQQSINIGEINSHHSADTATQNQLSSLPTNFSASMLDFQAGVVPREEPGLLRDNRTVLSAPVALVKHIPNAPSPQPRPESVAESSHHSSQPLFSHKNDTEFGSEQQAVSSVATDAWIKSTKARLSEVPQKSTLFRTSRCLFPSPQVEIKIIDSTIGAFRTVDRPFCRGEALIRATSVMEGYFGDVQRNMMAMEGEWLRTGDLVLWDQNNGLTVLDRMDNIVTIDGRDTQEKNETASNHFQEVADSEIGVASVSIKSSPSLRSRVSLTAASMSCLIMNHSRLVEHACILPISSSTAITTSPPQLPTYFESTIIPFPSGSSSSHSEIGEEALGIVLTLHWDVVAQKLNLPPVNEKTKKRLCSDQSIHELLKSEIKEIISRSSLDVSLVTLKQIILPLQFSKENGLLSENSEVKRHTVAFLIKAQLEKQKRRK
ncbi:putative AMP-binding enzyme [Blattamonas nauphoetae]|uniref:AMP-binding enzyme n=1 Tax=Blattamonas nauphoetae TaxID=2049346 RepID=A0ABQ9X619_9EUKA|nr:putative AMP-binding enzyme [Blattamonas nauphoetae]